MIDDLKKLRDEMSKHPYCRDKLTDIITRAETEPDYRDAALRLLKDDWKRRAEEAKEELKLGGRRVIERISPQRQMLNLALHARGKLVEKKFCDGLSDDEVDALKQFEKAIDDLEELEQEFELQRCIDDQAEEIARLTERCTKLQAKAWGMAAELTRLAKELEESE